jgi:error-prone DNA polymerase
LHCLTNYTFLQAASHPDELVARAAELGYAALAITDRNSLSGVVRAHVAAKDAGLKLLIGAEITPVDAPPVVLLATDRPAYGRLSRLITRGRTHAEKGDCRLTFDDVAEHAAGLLACVVWRRESRVESPELRIPCPLADVGNPSADDDRCRSRLSTLDSPLSAHLARYRDVFADGCFVLAELHHGADDERRLRDLLHASRTARVPAVAANDVHYHIPERRRLHDVLTAIHHGCPVAALGDKLSSNAERHLKSPRQMRALFASTPELIDRTVEIASRCSFTLDELRYEYPEELCPNGVTPMAYLTRLTWAGANERYPRGIPAKVRQLLEHELRLIEDLQYANYFLTVWDLVRFARSRSILCQGRGSAANSAVCFCLGITSVDPEQIDVLFERFISKERNEAPDIDVDFEHERREEVIQYVYHKYGRDRAGMTAEVITYRPRSAVRDVGKALGLSLDRIDTLSKSLEHFHSEGDQFAARFREAGLNPTSPVGQQLIELSREIIGFPRHLSQHVGGLVITNGLLCELVPIENASMPGRTVIEWDKDDLDALGLLKVDCLSLGMLTAIRKCFDLVNHHTQQTLTLAGLPREDPVVYNMVSRADTVGVFQIESRAQMAMLPRLRPRCFYDLVIEVAIVRPGPIQGDMVHPYLRRRRGEEPVEYPDDRVRAVLDKTLGVPIFQEQAMRLAVVAAGFTPGEADQLRRAMGAWRRPGIIDQFRRKLIDGLLANGYSADFADRLFRQLRGFGEYGFPESHAASFALLVYASAWLKRYHPAAFTVAILNSQPMGFYAPAQLVADVRKHGVEVRPVDVNFSEWNCTLEPVPAPPHSVPSQGRSLTIRLGFRMISGFSRSDAERIVKVRDTPFTTFDDFAHRTGLSSAILKRLSQADVFGSLQIDRRTAMWDALPDQTPAPLFESLPDDESPVELPSLLPYEQVTADYHTIGLSLRAHPVSFLRQELQQLRVVAANDLGKLPNGRLLRVAGLVLMRQRPSTAKGITFVTLEDETGQTNLIIRPEIWERYHRAARKASALLAYGTLQNQQNVIHVLVSRLEDLSAQLADVATRSRDFR